jgi:signal transduction histidine kinase
VAHEIYNPLASVRLGLQALIRRAKSTEKLDAETSEYLGMVDGEVEKCIRVTKRLLDLSQVPSQSLQLVSLSTVIPEVISLLRYEAEQSQIELVFDLSGEDLRVFATDSELRMLILNLAQNAFHAMPKGGTLTVSGRHEGNDVVVTFKDTGVGIEAEVLEHIFEPFYSKRADGVQGTGLGLTICKAIVARYQGQIGVESTPGKGTAFTITFPKADANRTLT